MNQFPIDLGTSSIVRFFLETKKLSCVPVT